MELKDMIKELRLKEHKHKMRYLSLQGSEQQRHDAIYTAYGLFADCLEAPWLTKLSNVGEYIKDVKQYLLEDDLVFFRQLYKLCNQYEEVAIGDTLGGKEINNWQDIERLKRRSKANDKEISKQAATD